MRLIAAVTLVLCLLVGQAAVAETRYIPGVAIVPEIRTPDGSLRVYATPRGPMYWSPGYPIPPGDTIKLNVFVSTGGDKLEIVKVRLDNQEIASLTSTPWSVEYPAAKLGTGYHGVEAWAKCVGKHGKTNSATVLLFIGPEGEKVPTPEEASKDPKRFALALIGVSDKDLGPELKADQPAVQKAINADRPIVLDGPVVLKVKLPEGKKKLVYSLVRNWKEEYRSPLLPGDSQIKLRPATPQEPGLLPGELLLIVWGADDSGNLGQPAVVSVSVPKPKE